VEAQIHPTRRYAWSKRAPPSFLWTSSSILVLYSNTTTEVYVYFCM
jgi:hypothetical protein